VVSNPSDLAGYSPGGRPLSSLDVGTEVDRAQAGLVGIRVTPLASGGAATLNEIISHLRDGYDILYMVCHGALID
jgi:hypothetical protein